MSYTVNDVHVHTRQEFDAILRNQRILGLAMAWRWVTQVASALEANEMVETSLKAMSMPADAIDDVIREAKSWDEVQHCGPCEDGECSEHVSPGRQEEPGKE